MDGFSKIARPFILMLKIISPTGLSTILQLSINAANKDEIDGDKSGRNETNLSNPSVSKKSIKVGYLISGGAKKDDGNTNSGGGIKKKSVKIAKSFDYLTPDARKVFNYL